MKAGRRLISLIAEDAIEVDTAYLTRLERQAERRKYIPTKRLLCRWAIVAAVLMVTACGQSGSAPVAESTDFVSIAGQFVQPGALTSNGADAAPVGSCANLSGPAVNAVLNVVDCGSPQSTYRIVRRTNTPQECGDADRPFYHNSAATGQYTACLDLAWDSSSCLSLGQPVTKVACDDQKAPQKYKPLKVIVDTTTLDGCTAGGYPHPARRFTVCTQPQP